jgi:hypothetical protein
MYAPALVAFVGGPGFGIGIGIGVQAWFPLGPREPFMPWYHYGPNYIHAFNGVAVTDVSTLHYANRGVAVTAVSGDVFRGGQPVERGMVHVTPDQLAHAQVIPHPEVSPTSRAVFGARAVEAPPVRAAGFRASSSGAPSSLHTPAPASAPREAMRTGGPPTTPFPKMFTHNAPAPTNAPYAARQDAYSSHPGRALEPQQMNNLRAGKPAGPMQDKETIPHPAPAKGNTKTSSSSKGDKDHH